MKNFCMFACSDEFQLQENALEFVGIIQDLSRQLGIVLTHFDYALAEDENVNNMTHESPFDTDSTDQLKLVLGEQSVWALALWAGHDEPGKEPYFDLDSELVDTGLVNGYKYTYVHFPMDYIGNLTSITLFSFANSLLSSLNRLGKLDYALIMTMDAALPSTYFHGIFTSGLSDDEALNLATWERKFVERKIRLRGLYWGNLLSAEHLSRLADKGVFIDRLEALVGSHRLATINGDDLFFMLPSSDIATDPVAGSVEALLKEHDLLMQPDDEAKRVVGRLVSR